MTESTPEPSGNHFPSLDLDATDVNLGDLHTRVARSNQRVELIRNGNSCVLISKEELEGLEKALEILSNTETVRGMRDQIALVANFAAPYAPALPAQHASNSRARSFNSP